MAVSIMYVDKFDHTSNFVQHHSYPHAPVKSVVSKGYIVKTGSIVHTHKQTKQ